MAFFYASSQSKYLSLKYPQSKEASNQKQKINQSFVF
ncbi:MAG: hypothetical protein ACJAZH_000289 [Roseivirga sp.]|jgi:hypothetical protein